MQGAVTATRSGVAVGVSGKSISRYSPFDPSVDQQYLFSLAQSVVPACGFTVNSGPFTGVTLYSPGAGGNYYGANMVVRDQVMMLRGAPHLFTATQIGNIVDALASIQGYGNMGASGQGVAEGISQNGSVFAYGLNAAPGGIIPVDNAFEFVDAVYTHFKKTGSATKFTQHETKILLAVDSQAVNDHLVYLSNEETDRVEFGFQDSITIRGYVLVCSLFRYRAYRQISEMLASLGRNADANGRTVSQYNATLTNITNALVSRLWHPQRGLFYTGTLQNTAQHSVPGSAYAVVLGAVPSEIADIISDTLFNMLPGQSNAANGCFLGGQVRHFPLDDPYFTIMRSSIPQGAYQNGGYWGTFTAWAAAAIRRKHPSAANLFMKAWADTCRSNGVNAPIEAQGGSWSYSYPYGANAALPLLYYDNQNTR